MTNGSPRATFETTDDRLTFLIHIPVHAGCGNKPNSNIDYGDGSSATERTTKTATEISQKTTERTTERIIRLIRENQQITSKELAEACGITEDGVY